MRICDQFIYNFQEKVLLFKGQNVACHFGRYCIVHSINTVKKLTKKIDHAPI